MYILENRVVGQKPGYTYSQKTPDGDLEVTHTPSMLTTADTSPDAHAIAT